MSMPYTIDQQTLILENGVKRTFKTPIQQVEQIEDEGWFILLEDYFPNNLMGLKPDGALFWRVKPQDETISIQKLMKENEMIFCETHEGKCYRLNTQTGTLELL